MSGTVLVTAPYMLPVVERFRSRFTDHGLELRVAHVEERLGEDALLQLIGDIDGVICGDDAFSARVLAAAPRLRVISKWGTGIDSIDREACARLGIAVRNTPNAFTEPVADSVLGYVLAFARRQPWMDRAMKRGEWMKLPGFTLAERTLGIIGLGNIGRAVARRARAFGMPVLACDIASIEASVVESLGVQMTTRDELLARSDFISLNCDLNRTSRHMIDRSALQRMRGTAVLINTARGPIVDEPALEQALLNQTIAGAALDVFEVEPLPADSPLRTLDQVMIAPHNSNSSPRAWERVHESTIANLLSVLLEPRCTKS